MVQVSFSTQRIVLTQGSCVSLNTVPLLYSRLFSWMLTTTVSYRCPLPDNSLSTQSRHPGWQQITAHEFSTTVSTPCLYAYTWKTDGRKRLRRFVLGVTMLIFGGRTALVALATNSCYQENRGELQGGSRDFFFHTENSVFARIGTGKKVVLDAGISRTGNKYCTTRLYSRLLSCSTGQTL